MAEEWYTKVTAYDLNSDSPVSAYKLAANLIGETVPKAYERAAFVELFKKRTRVAIVTDDIVTSKTASAVAQSLSGCFHGDADTAAAYLADQEDTAVAKDVWLTAVHVRRSCFRFQVGWC